MKQIDEQDPAVVALRAGERKFHEVMERLASKQKELAQATEIYTRMSSLEVEASKLLDGNLLDAGINADEIESIQHDIDVAQAAVELQRQVVAKLRGEFSLAVCAANRDQYIAIEKRIARAVEELAEANEAEAKFIDELQQSGCSSISFRPMRIAQVGFWSDPQSRASLHRRELAEHLPEALTQ